MNRNVLIVIIFSLFALVCMAFLVISPEHENDGDTTITVMESYTEMSSFKAVQTSAENSEVKTITKTTSDRGMTYTYTNAVPTTTTAVTTETTAQTEEVIPEEVIAENITEVIFIDINTAGVEELILLDGIGEVTAQAIVDYRDLHGGFNNIEEIMNVKGIGAVKFENIRDFIFVENPVYFYEEEPVTENEEIYEQPVIEVYEETPPTADVQPTDYIPKLEDYIPININTADIEILMLIPQVDEEVAKAIIKLREDIGGYSHVYELLYIDILTQKQVAELTEFVTVGE
ncbi:MAG: helix-hairpin-helix domain-containing protein [Ruminococcus sp.]|nr:helix-hairpin-helix domain-containing protein [Ruminococcus sp.]